MRIFQNPFFVMPEIKWKTLGKHYFPFLTGKWGSKIMIKKINRFLWVKTPSFFLLSNPSFCCGDETRFIKKIKLIHYLLFCVQSECWFRLLLVFCINAKRDSMIQLRLKFDLHKNDDELTDLSINKLQTEPHEKFHFDQ